MQLGGAASALAVVGLGKVGEFEINGECFGYAVSLIDRKTGNDVSRPSQQGIFERG